MISSTHSCLNVSLSSQAPTLHSMFGSSDTHSLPTQISPESQPSSSPHSTQRTSTVQLLSQTSESSSSVTVIFTKLSPMSVQV